MGCGESSFYQNQNLEKKFSEQHEFDMYAAITGNKIEKVQALITGGFDVNYKMLRFMRRSCLHIAADSGQFEIFTLLYSLGGNLNQKDQEGVVPLFLACSKSNLKIVDFCLENNAKFSLTTSRGLTLIDFIPRGSEKLFESVFKKRVSYSILKRYNFNNQVYCLTE